MFPAIHLKRSSLAIIAPRELARQCTRLEARTADILSSIEVFSLKNPRAPSIQNCGRIPPVPGRRAPPNGPPQTLSESPLRFRLGFSSGFQHIPGQSPMTPQAGHHAVMLGRMSHQPSNQSASVARAQVSASGTASPTVWQRGQVSVANRRVGLKSSVNIVSRTSVKVVR